MSNSCERGAFGARGAEIEGGGRAQDDPFPMCLGRDALWRCRGRDEALGGDVRRGGDDLLLVEVAEDVGDHRRHLFARLHLSNRAVLVNAAARDALEQLLKVDRHVLHR